MFFVPKQRSLGSGRVGCWVVGSLGRFGGFALDEAGRPQEFLRDSRGTLARGECLGDPWPSCVTKNQTCLIMFV